MTDTALNNWGRWGSEDQKGALNLLTPEVLLKAIRLVKKGVVYSLSVPLERDGPQFPKFHKTWKVMYISSYTDPKLKKTENKVTADEVLTMEVHSGTHIDGLGHVWNNGRLYNNISEDQVNMEGLWKVGIENVRSMVGRGVMLDIPTYRGIDHMEPGEIVTVEDLDGAATAQGISIEPGDIVMIRTGWYKLFYQDRTLWETAYPGPDESIAPWLKKKDVCAIGADNPGVEVIRSVANLTHMPLHHHALRDLGIYLLENLDLEELSRDKVYEFLFVGAPLRLMRATGAPWNPLAIV